MNELKELLQDVEYIIDASDAEQFLLYELNTYTKKISIWERGQILWDVIGHGDCGRPICLQVSTAKLDGVVVAFWGMTSMLCDYELAERVVRDNAPTPCVYTDANNFHQVLNYINTKLGRN